MFLSFFVCHKQTFLIGQVSEHVPGFLCMHPKYQIQLSDFCDLVMLNVQLRLIHSPETHLQMCLQYNQILAVIGKGKETKTCKVSRSCVLLQSSNGGTFVDLFIKFHGKKLKHDTIKM